MLVGGRHRRSPSPPPRSRSAARPASRRRCCFVLAAGIPAAGWLALERGRLYGAQLHRRAALSLAIEPVVRLALGIPLLLAAGAVGGAIAVVLGGFAALAVTRPFGKGPDPDPNSAGAEVVGRLTPTEFWEGPGPFAKAGGLGDAGVPRASRSCRTRTSCSPTGCSTAAEAGRFAVLSTLGGAAAFATTTVPLVLLPRAARGEHLALAGAIGAAVLLGGGGRGGRSRSSPTRSSPPRSATSTPGSADLAVPYVAAMALFGVARVLVAHRSRDRRRRRGSSPPSRSSPSRRPARIVVVRRRRRRGRGRDAHGHRRARARRRRRRAAARAPARRRPRGPRRRPRPPREPVDTRVALTLAGAHRRRRSSCAWRSPRGIWLDEATSITQAQMPLGEMHREPAQPATSTRRCTTSSCGRSPTRSASRELAMRAPSILAGTAMVPVLYLLGRELYDTRAATFAAALAAFAPFLVWYSQEARMYALFMLFAALAMLGQLRALRRGRARDWLLWGVARSLLLWTQYFGSSSPPSRSPASRSRGGACGARAARCGATCCGWLGDDALVALAFAPLAEFCVDQFQANQAAGKGFNAPKQAGDVDPEGKEPGVYLALTNFVWAIVGYHADNVMALLTVGVAAGDPRRAHAARPPRPAADRVRRRVRAAPRVHPLRARRPQAVPLRGALLRRRGAAAARAARPRGDRLGARRAGDRRGERAARRRLRARVRRPAAQRLEPARLRLRGRDRRGQPRAPARRRAALPARVPAGRHPLLRRRRASSAARWRTACRRDRHRIFVVASFQDSANNRRALREGQRELEKNYELVRTERRPQIRVCVYERKEVAR